MIATQNEKMQMKQRNLKAEDPALFFDDRAGKGMRPLGPVMKVIADGEREVRIAEVKTTMGYEYSPITKLCFLEADNQDDSNESEDNVADDKLVMNSEENNDDQTIPAPVYTRPNRTTRVPSTSKLKRTLYVSEQFSIDG